MLESLKGKPSDVRVMTSVSVANVLSQSLIGQRFEPDDPKLQKLFTLMNEVVGKLEGASLVHFFPFLKYAPGDPFGAKALEAKAKEIKDIFSSFVQQHDEDKSKDSNDASIDNVVAAYNYEKKRKLEAGGMTMLDDENLVKTLLDMFMIGFDTVNTTIAWCLLYILHHPDVQEKIFREIEAEVGPHRLPSLHDKNSLPYLSAVIMETQRLGSVLPLNIPRKCNTETEVLGYKIPKGATVIPNLDSVLSDPEVWGDDANLFRPERFIDASGKLVQKEELIPYSMGRRGCPGEAFANMQLFIFLAVLFQRFRFLPADAKNLPTLKGFLGTSNAPSPYDVRVISRA
ncbi:cytochrome P450 2U1-like [Aplysia californica]|uniref:Cytochrome P450 2U1-like n=1 Tax=Aplysia californica TaxID=6500 RepID=A0ABM0JBQ4_APLCA|nr:cytochrome P450 2U1-like [Aplysia californica]